jgi:thioredoxin-related protein
MISWGEYEKGMAQAKQDNKLIFLNFYADWCGYCKKMDDETFVDRAVANYLQDHFVAIRINADKEEKVASIYGVRGLPLFCFLKPNGEPISSLPGYIPPEKFLNILKFIKTGSYEKMSFNDFMEKQ